MKIAFLPTGSVLKIPYQFGFSVGSRAGLTVA